MLAKNIYTFVIFFSPIFKSSKAYRTLRANATRAKFSNAVALPHRSVLNGSLAAIPTKYACGRNSV